MTVVKVTGGCRKFSRPGERGLSETQTFIFFSYLGMPSPTLPFPGYEPPQSDAHLNRVYSWIRRRQSCVRNMHVSHFHAPVIGLAQKMGSQRDPGGEVHVGSSGWHFVGGEKRPSGEFEVGH